VMVRGTGATLALAPFNIGGVLTDPKLQLFSGNTVIAQNDSWGTAPNLAAIMAANGTQLGPVTLAATDTVMLSALSSGPYTAQITGNNNTTGIALIEVFDTDTADPGSATFAAQPSLINLSARTQVGTGDNILIAGFIINGNVPRRVMIRGIGPTLANFGVSGLLANPKLQLFSGNTVIAENDEWASSSNLSTITAINGDKLGSFTLDAHDAVLVVTLPPGPYTAQVSGVNGGTGVALIEVDDEP